MLKDLELTAVRLIGIPDEQLDFLIYLGEEEAMR